MQTIMIVEDDPDIRDGVRIALDCNRVWVDEQEADLTETEYKILKLLMQIPQRIFPVQVIYETVWGEPYFYVSNAPSWCISAICVSSSLTRNIVPKPLPSAAEHSFLRHITPSAVRRKLPGLPKALPLGELARSA